MGNCMGSDAAVAKTKAIDREQRRKAVDEENKIRILLLGAGESGKSTLFKQMKLLYTREKEFAPDEKFKYKKSIYKNILKDTQVLIGALKQRKMDFFSTEAKDAEEAMMKWNQDTQIGPEQAAHLKAVWNDKAIQAIWDTRGDVQVQDAYEYYMINIDRIASSKYEPSNQDILRVRVKTSGVVTAKFEIDHTNFEMYDVGGQRNERAKWIHYFDGVTTVLFVAAVSEYNQVLFEDAHVNRQAEAVELFKKQLCLDTFIDTPFILFLNKKDLFREKLAKIPFRVDSGEEKRNVDFQGPFLDMNKTYDYEHEGKDAEFEAGYDAALKYLAMLYESQAPPNRGKGGQIYTHVTNSTDSKNIQSIMNACKDIIIKENFSHGGFL